MSSMSFYVLFYKIASSLFSKLCLFSVKKENKYVHMFALHHHIAYITHITATANDYYGMAYMTKTCPVSLVGKQT